MPTTTTFLTVAAMVMLAFWQRGRRSESGLGSALVASSRREERFYGGAERFRARGVHATMCWRELATGDVGAAMAFYSELLGWTAVPTGMGDLVACPQADDFIARVSPAPDGVPAHWAVFFAVDDCDAVVEHCGRLGGRTMVPAMDQPPGRMAQLADDQGAMFWVIAPNPDISISPG